MSAPPAEISITTRARSGEWAGTPKSKSKTETLGSLDLEVLAAMVDAHAIGRCSRRGCRSMPTRKSSYRDVKFTVLLVQ